MAVPGRRAASWQGGSGTHEVDSVESRVPSSVSLSRMTVTIQSCSNDTGRSHNVCHAEIGEQRPSVVVGMFCGNRT